MRAALLLWAMLPAALPVGPLYDRLHRFAFRNSGTTRSEDAFHWEAIEAVGEEQEVIYLEADNVSCVHCTWADGGKYHKPHRYLFKTRDVPHPHSDKPGVYLGDAPASGMRSAVPLGGLSTGSFELRGDGTLHEWTVHNAGPSGAAKVQQYPDAHFSIRLGSEARVIQTHPQASSSDGGLAGFGVPALRYSGSHPVSRLDLLPAAGDDPFLSDGSGAVVLNASLFAFSAFKIGDMQASARPAAAFHLAVANNGDSLTAAGFAFQLPHLIEVDQGRPGVPLPAAAQPAAGVAASPVACAHACRGTGGCQSWTFDGAGKCVLQADAPLNRYAPGVTSGLPGTWALDASRQCLTLMRPGMGPMHGNLTVCAAAEGLANSTFLAVTSDSPSAAFRHLQSSAAASSRVTSPAAAAASPFKELGNADWNQPHSVVVPGSANHVASLAACEAMCSDNRKCAVGLFLNGTVRHGECWLASRRAEAPILAFCGAAPGQSCASFEKVAGPRPPPPPPPAPTGLRGIYGTASVAGTVAAGATATLTLTLGWRFPRKDFYNYASKGAPQTSFVPFGNHYATLYPSAIGAAWGDVPVPERSAALASVADDIWAFHEPFLNSSLPAFLQDQLVNSLSHTRDSLWFVACPHCHESADPRVNASMGNGFWRQYEAFDCTDIDSVHNDGERHMPYISFFPDGTRSKMAAWAGNQAANGMLPEQIANTNPDAPAGRINSDVTSMFIVYVLELLRWDNDTVTAGLYYPTVKRGAEWMMSTAATYDLPLHLENTYDVLHFNDHELSAYASAWHMVGLRAAALLAEFAGDRAFAANCSRALERAQAAMDQLLWNGSHYAAQADGCKRGVGCDQKQGVFSDAFYAQVLANGLGLGDVLARPSRLDSHLATVHEANCVHTDVRGGEGTYRLVPGCDNGLITVTGRPVGVSDLQIWQMASNDHASLVIHRSAGNASAVAAALKLAGGQATAYTQRHNDQWNVAGITLNDGRSSITSHYGYHMTNWHIPKALSGALLDLSAAGNRSLTFAPKLPCPLRLPWFAPNRLGSVSCDSAGTLSVALHTGPDLVLDTVAVDGSAFPGTKGAAVTLAVGIPLIWRPDMA